jgi:hypothetical protein
MISDNYRGAAHPHLSGKRAIIRPHENDPQMLLAQFDDLSLTESHGWTALPRETFEMFQQIAEIDNSFARATGWGSRMADQANSREYLVNKLIEADFDVEHKHQARTGSGGRVS